MHAQTPHAQNLSRTASVFCCSSAASASIQPIGTAAAAPDKPIFVPRSNPRHLFLQTQLPSTEAALAPTSSTATPNSKGKQISQPSKQQQQRPQDNEAGLSHQRQENVAATGQSQGRQQWTEPQEPDEMQQEDDEDKDQPSLNDNQVPLKAPLSIAEAVPVPDCSYTCTWLCACLVNILLMSPDATACCHHVVLQSPSIFTTTRIAAL